MKFKLLLISVAILLIALLYFRVSSVVLAGLAQPVIPILGIPLRDVRVVRDEDFNEEVCLLFELGFYRNAFHTILFLFSVCFCLGRLYTPMSL
jgi:hypothetical protein